jgi:hypothetical protein
LQIGKRPVFLGGAKKLLADFRRWLWFSDIKVPENQCGRWKIASKTVVFSIIPVPSLLLALALHLRGHER